MCESEGVWSANINLANQLAHLEQIATLGDVEGDGLEPCIADVLLDELNAQTRDEDVANRVVDYIVEVLMDKKRKAYVLHPRAKGVPAAVEVDMPNIFLSKKDISTLIIPTLIHDKVVERVGCVDCYLPSDDDTIKAYIVLEKI